MRILDIGNFTAQFPVPTNTQLSPSLYILSSVSLKINETPYISTDYHSVILASLPLAFQES